MTARDEALHAVMRADNNWHHDSSPGDYSGGTDYWLTILNAIPGDVLVGLAKDQGALEEVSVDTHADTVDDLTETLFRVVEP